MARPYRFSYPLLQLVLALAAACALATGARASECDSTSKGFIPLMDLGAGTYKGQGGGLYPGGSNQPPPAHAAAGLAQAQAIAPLDTLGQPDSTGAIAMVSIGMCNTSLEYTVFVPLANAYSGKNPRVALVNGAQGGQTAHVFANPAAPAWNVIDDRLRSQGFHPLQVQVIWLKEANAGPTQAFPAHAESLRNDLRNVVRNARDRYPNARLCYLSSRIYAGYASSTLNPEPYAYESAFSVRWLIEEQINGDAALNFDPGAGPVEAPWLGWGPYLWADGLVPRSDGLTWECSDFNADGTHPGNVARTKVADMLFEFLTTDATATPWFLRSALRVEPVRSGRAIEVRAPWPNPFSASVSLAIDLTQARRVQLDVLTPSGRRLRRLADSQLAAGRWTFEWDGRDRNGARVGPGVYYLRVQADGAPNVTRRVSLTR